VRPGHTRPYGTSLVPGGINFSIFSSAATSCTLVLFDSRTREVTGEIVIPDSFRIGDVWSIVIFDLDPESFEYGYRMNGPWDPASGHRFDPSIVLLDPYVRSISGRNVWGAPPDWKDEFPYRGFVIPEDFDWRGDHPLEILSEDMIVYEESIALNCFQCSNSTNSSFRL